MGDISWWILHTCSKFEYFNQATVPKDFSLLENRSLIKKSTIYRIRTDVFGMRFQGPNP